MIRAAIFDIDGTLIDSVDLHARAWVEALARFGIAADFARMRHAIGKGSDQLLPDFVPPDVLDAREEEITSCRSDLFKREYLPRVRPFPAVPELFRRIRQDGTRIVLASSGKADEIDTYAAIAEIGDLVDEKVSADDARTSKPAGDIFAAALARASPIGAQETIVVGDTRWDVEAAAKVGLATLGLRCGGVPEAELLAAGAIAVHADPADLLAHYADTPLAPSWSPGRRGGG